MVPSARRSVGGPNSARTKRAAQRDRLTMTGCISLLRKQALPAYQHLRHWRPTQAPILSFPSTGRDNTMPPVSILWSPRRCTMYRRSCYRARIGLPAALAVVLSGLLLSSARTEEQKKGGTIELFNGKDLHGWK